MRVDRWRLALTCVPVVAVVVFAPSHRAAAAELRIPMFKTPSGNIVCAFFDRSLRCDIRSGLSPKPARPRGCPSYSDFGQGLNLGPRRAGVVCAGDSVLGGAPVLAYGRAWRRGPITCRSRIAGLTCKNTLRHGFFLSRGSWRLF